MPDRTALTKTKIGPGKNKQLDDLPEEMLQEILIRLPSKDVGRCRVVSPSWRSAASKPDFMLEHHDRQPLLPIVDGEMKRAGYVVLGGVGAGTSKQQGLPLMLQERIFSCFTLLKGSCDGFFIIYLLEPDQFSICNPITCKAALLPKPPMKYNSVIGFYYHHPTREYKVLWLSQFLVPPSKYKLYVLTVGDDKPRHVIPRMPTVLSPSMEHELLNRLRCSSTERPPVHLHGSLHWCPFGDANDITGGSGDIIVFNTQAESFRWMHSPAKRSPKSKLFDMKGALAFWAFSVSFTSMDVWVMQDYEAEIWSFKYRIDLSKVEVSRQLYLSSAKKKKKTPHDSEVQFFNDMAVVNERELLIRYNKKYVLRCDIDGNVLGLVKLGKNQYCMSLTQHRLQESILPIPFHEMQG